MSKNVEEMCDESLQQGIKLGIELGQQRVFKDAFIRERFEEGFEEGFIEGFMEGLKKDSQVIARRMLLAGKYGLEEITVLCGLSLDEVKEMEKKYIIHK